ncbi:MAG TPA: cupin domain-containing protein [Gemmatimonadaceae bacterium]|nr:cupin domain-containing protein [Gemmatimonadaceae bacterium]
MDNRSRWVETLIALLLITVPVGAQQTGMASSKDSAIATVRASSLAWAPIQPTGFDSGMEIAVVRGDPAAAGKPYVVRLRFNDGYRFPPHWHPVAENLSVLEGQFLLAMGEKADESRLTTYQPGDYLFIESKHPHFGGAKGRTAIQLHGVGPFEIVVVGSPQDKR